MSFFRQPGESSSDDESSDDEQELDQGISQNSAKSSNDTLDDIVETVTTETLSLTNTISNGENGRPANIDTARDTITTALLEELAKYRAADVLKSPDKDSPEVEQLAKELFSRSSRVLAGHGIISPESATEEKKSQRTWYLNELERASYAIGASSKDDNDTLLSTDMNYADAKHSADNMLVQRSRHEILAWPGSDLAVVGRPSTELSLARAVPLHLNSHYRSAFVEQGRLGKGGFGEVFHARNVYDQREYAIKKIPLSPKLAQHYNKGGISELKHILKEVQALAKLEHCNVVRYHATWLEEPTAMNRDELHVQARPIETRRGLKLLDNVPAASNAPPIDAPHSHGPTGPFYEHEDAPVMGKIISASSSDLEKDENNPFEHSQAPKADERLLWSQQRAITASLSYAEDCIFDDGRSHQRESLISADLNNAPSDRFVLHVQMSMYPLTLAEYLSPASSSTGKASTPSSRHCYHLVPSLRLLNGILHGVQYIHSQGYIHRDIKPGNIFLSRVEMITPEVFNLEQGFVDVSDCPTCPVRVPLYLNPRIGDFGLVADLERAVGTDNSPTTEAHAVNSSHEGVGTQYYRPPRHEQKSNPIDEKLDVFALGVVFLELLCYCSTSSGRHALLTGCQDGITPKEFDETLAANCQSQSVNDKVKECVHGMLDTNPTTRWRCAMVKSMVEHILAELDVQPSASVSD